MIDAYTFGQYITVTLRGDDWHACVTGDPTRWGCGRSVAEAIGNLIMAHIDLVTA